MEYELLPLIIEEGLKLDYSLRDRLLMLRFCSNISHYDNLYCRSFLRDGGDMWLKVLGDEIASREYQDEIALNVYLLQIQPFVQVFKVNS
jgi:hypothetical protein